MAQQQRNRNEFGTDQRDNDVRDRDPRVLKNYDQESDRWRDEFGSRAGADVVANSAYANIGSGGYGAPPTGGPYAGANYGASGFEFSTAGATTGAAPGHDTPAELWGREGNADQRGGDGGRDMNADVDQNRNRNMGRDQKK